MTRHRLEDQMLDHISKMRKRRTDLEIENGQLNYKINSLLSTIDQLMDHIAGHCADPECRLLPSAEPDTPEPPRRGLLGRKLPRQKAPGSDSAKSTEGEER